MAHGYLVHEFLSISNKREDDYRGNFENRMKFALNIVKKVRGAISENTILLARFLQLIMPIMAGMNISQLAF